MPELVNETPFPNFRYYSTDNQGQEFGIIIVKSTWEIAPDGTLVPAEEQAPMVFTDLCHGALNTSSLWHPSDLVPKKVATDILLNAVARAPNGEPAPEWICGFEVLGAPQGLIRHALRVTGPRFWRAKWKRQPAPEDLRAGRHDRKDSEGWALTPPEPVTALPLRYEFAFGGAVPRGQDDAGVPLTEDSHENPIGRGWLDAQWSDPAVDHPAPQIEFAGAPITDPFTPSRPAGVGPIPPAWLPRRPLGGTYDQNWQDNIWPNWPLDYSFAYHNSAHPSLICQGFLSGAESFRLHGFWSVPAPQEVRLPGVAMNVTLLAEDQEPQTRAMALDTVFFDIAAPERKDARVFLCWRLDFEPDRFERAVIFATGLGEAMELREGKVA
jgi:hypothetical protein